MKHGLLVGAGFLLGSVGLKALTSKPAKKVYVKGIVQGMRAKEEIGTMIDDARAEFDDLIAEAGYVKKCEDGEASETEESDEEDSDDESDKQVKKTTSTSTKKTAESKSASASAGKGTGRGSGNGRDHGHGHGGK